MASVQGPSSSSPPPQPPPPPSPLRLFVDKERNEVVVGEASGDFIDALLSFLTLPLGTIIRLLSNGQTHPSAELGCINNLYRSVQNFNTEVFRNEICKNMLLCPRNPCEKLCQKLRFNVDDTEPTKYFICGSCGGGSEKWLSTFAGASCSCGKVMDHEMEMMGEEDINNPKEDGVFVRGKSMYLIFDDLTVLQNSTCNTIDKLAQLGHIDSTKLTEISPEVGLRQIMDLLKSALITTSPLTDVFVARVAGGSKPAVPSFRPMLARQNVQESDSCCNLRMIVSKSEEKILYAEADEDFADFLFSFLTLPLGSTLKLLLDADNLNMGSMPNLYKSVNALNPSCFRLNHSPFLDLKVASQHGYKKQRLLDVREEESPFYWYGSGVHRNNACHLKICGVIPTPKKKKIYGVISKAYDKVKSASSMKLFDPRCADRKKEAVGFVRRPAILAIMDNLQVTPLTSTSSMSFLQNLKVPLNDLEVKDVTIHKIEALNLFNASLTSKSALTMAFPTVAEPGP